jgi:hypothetical protein
MTWFNVMCQVDYHLRKSIIDPQYVKLNNPGGFVMEIAVSLLA